MNIFMLNTTEDGFNLYKMLQGAVPIKGMIGLTDRQADDSISGYVSCRERCDKLGIPFVGVESYALRDEQDKSLLSGLDIDVLIVSGWQRLVPDWLIDSVKQHVIGFHGSPWGITKGRGRSPQNWSLLLGEAQFSLSLFHITAGIDDGEVFQTKEFVYQGMDDIKTSHYKVSVLGAEMVKEYYARLKNGELHAVPQIGEPLYLPQRKPEDGYIDWRCSTGSIYNHIRALTRPYPGAKTVLNGADITIWKARGFELGVDVPHEFGTVYAVFDSKEFLVGTGDGLLLVEEYHCETACGVRPGDTFESVDIYEQFQAIISRHEEKYPELPIVPEIYAHAGRARCAD